jgi:hypothetical protein
LQQQKRARSTIGASQAHIQVELQPVEKAGFEAIFLAADNTGANGIQDRSLRLTGVRGDASHNATFDVDTPTHLLLLSLRI